MFRATNDPTETRPASEHFVWSSRESDSPGVGFPSCCTDLARIPRNTKDPSGYYRLLGLPPWASIDEIKRTCRKLLARFHPDGPEPDEPRFRRIEEIYRILSDPVRKVEYERTPEGHTYVDSEVREKIKDLAFERGFSPEEVREMFSSDGDLTPVHAASTDWDFYAEGLEEGDHDRARAWYPELLAVGSTIGYAGRLKLFLTDDRWGFDPRSGIVRAPRDATPDRTNAIRLLVAFGRGHGTVVERARNTK